MGTESGGGMKIYVETEGEEKEVGKKGDVDVN